MAIFKKKDKDEAVKTPKQSVEKKAAEKKSPTKKATAKKTKEVSLEARLKAQHVLLGPVVTEKSAVLSEQNVLVVRVAPEANRISIRKAIQTLYNVTPEKVNVMNVRGKRVRFGRTFGKRSDWKKAVIVLPEGAHIDIFEGV